MPDELNALLSKPLSEMGLSARLIGVCHNAGFETVVNLVKLCKMDFLKLRNFGKKTMSELEDFVESKELSFNMKF